MATKLYAYFCRNSRTRSALRHSLGRFRERYSSPPCAALFPYRPRLLPRRVGRLVLHRAPHWINQAARKLPELLRPAFVAHADRLLGLGVVIRICHVAMGRRIGPCFAR